MRTWHVAHSCAGVYVAFGVAAIVIATWSGTGWAGQKDKPADKTDAPKAVERAGDLERLLEKVEAARRKLKRLSAHIEQVRHIEALDVDEKSTGTIKFAMPRLLRVELKHRTTGRRKILVIGKKHGWLYQPELEQVQRFLLKKPEESKTTPNPFEYGLASDVRDMRKTFDMRLLGEEKVNDRPAHKVELVPKKEHQAECIYDRIIFWIDSRLNLPVKVRQYKSDGEIIETYTLSKIKRNPLFIFSPFKFKPPRGVEVVDHAEERIL